MEISMVPSQFLNVVLEETKRNKSSSETPLSLSPCPFPKDENNCDDRIKTDGDKESLKRKHSIIEDRPHSNGLSEQEKRDLTARLPKALLAECTVEIHTSPPRERRAIRPRFDARVSPIYTAPKDRTRYNDWNIPGLQIIREAPLNLSASNSKIPPNNLCSSSSFLPENYRKKYNSEDIDYTTTNAHDALQLIEAVYSDQDDEDSHSREDLLIGAQKPTNGERKMRRPVPNLIEVSLTARANLRSAQSARNLGNPSLNPLTNFYSALASNLESLPTREAFANLPRSMLMANDSITSPILRKNVASPDQKFSFKCEHCPNVYPNRGALWQHSVATHSVEKTCECNICGRKFYRNCSLALHLKSHSEEEYCTCKECGKSFTRLINLERHMKVHSVSSDRYQCEHCDKSFPDRANLLRHSVCHGASSTQSRTHQCDTCGKSYKSKDHLDIHWQATHAVISCSMCAKSFTSFSELARHESAVHPDRPGQRYSCDQCGKSYSQIAVLRKHMISHTGERLRCSTCGIEFTQRSSLLRHVKRMHAKVQGDRNSGGVLRYGPEAVLGNENLRRLISLDIASASGGGIMGQNADQIKKSKTINALIERLNSSGQTKITGNPMHADSNPKSVEITKTSNQDSKVQNEDLSGSSLINPQALLEKFYNSNSSIRYLLEQKMNHLSPYSNLSVAAEFLKQIDSKSNVSSPLIASLNLNRNAFLTNSLLTASNNMALAAMMGAYGTTIETVPSDRFSNDVSVSEENSADDSLEDDDGGDYSEETDDDEADDNGSMEVNKYVADINDNEDSDNDNFVIDEDAIEEECSDSSTDADVMSNKNDQDLNSHDGDPQYRENNAGQNIDIKSDEETNEEFAIDTKTTNSFDSTKRTTELQNGIFLE